MAQAIDVDGTANQEIKLPYNSLSTVLISKLLPWPILDKIAVQAPGGLSFNIRLYQDDESRLDTISHISAEALEVVFNGLPGRLCNASALKTLVGNYFSGRVLGESFKDGLTEAFSSSSLAEIALRCYTVSYTPSDISATAKYMKYIFKGAYTVIFEVKPAFSAGINAATIGGKIYLANLYWNTSDAETGVCRGQNGTIADCAASFAFKDNFEPMEVGASIFPEESLLAYDIRNNLTLTPSGLTWTASGAGVINDVFSTENDPRKFYSLDIGSVSLSVLDPITQAKGATVINIVKPEIYPSNIKVNVGDVVMLKIANSSGTRIIANMSSTWESGDTSKLEGPLPSIFCLDYPQCAHFLAKSPGEITVAYKNPLRPNDTVTTKIVVLDVKSVLFNSRGTWLTEIIQTTDIEWPPGFWPGVLTPFSYPLSESGFSPGDMIQVRAVGSYLYSGYFDNPGTAVGAVGIFSSSSGYIGVGAISPTDPQAPFQVGPTFNGACPDGNVIAFDNPHDFYIEDNQWRTVKIPLNAVSISFSVSDCFHGDNVGQMRVDLRLVSPQ